MARSRAFEIAVAELWQRGLISGEMHLGTGEEAVAAGLTAHAEPGDAWALDHRGSPFLVMLGVDLVALLREMLGREDGLCRGRGGHMHLFSRAHLAASSGIVGSSGPAGAGFALSAKRLRPGAAAVALFGDGAMNQGMLLETLNLAVAWRLPLVLVCKDNEWAITTRSESVTGGDLVERAAAFGMPASRVDGSDPAAVGRAAAEAFQRARRGKGPSFLLCACPRLDGHFLGDPMIRTARHPVSEGREVLGQVASAVVRGRGAGPVARAKSLARMTGLLARVRGEAQGKGADPLTIQRKALRRQAEEVARIEEEAAAEVEAAVEAALREEG